MKNHPQFSFVYNKLIIGLRVQAPDKFRTGILRSPVCNLASNVGITDIPDWCYVEAFGKGLTTYSEAPSADDLRVLYQCSPIAHVFKVLFYETNERFWNQ